MGFIDKLVSWYFSRRALPYWGILLVDSLIVLFSGLACYALDHGAVSTLRVLRPLLLAQCLYLAFYVAGFRLMRTYQGVMRFTSFSDLYRVLSACLVGLCCSVLLNVLTPIDSWLTEVRLKELAFTAILSAVAMCMLRVCIRYVYDYAQRTGQSIPVFIYGVKNGGLGIARAIQAEKDRRFRLRGFVSDASDMAGRMLMGVAVYPNDERLPSTMRHRGVRALLVSPLKQDAFANDSVMADRMISAGIKVYTISEATRWDGKSDISTSQLREVEIEDLLPREEIEVDMNAVENLLRGKRVMVTGSAGSIGSEIVRQVAGFGPAMLLLVDQAETPQHDIRLMMSREFPHVRAEAVVTTVCNASRMEALFREYRPDYVFHAAAYKHVPMMEDNPCEAVQNNVGGTVVLADLSVRYGVRKFVMVSTDKAVNPTNVMGCSKRLCEIYVQSLDRDLKRRGGEGERTQFVTTRFGNVLGSNGSVIPLFREQIRRGGPVTVTHPDIYRYFMLIPEACRLVLEAGTMGNGGEIFVFDMGAPVRIADLARRMILLSGARNVEIKYTGLRDGEKLYEEVLGDEEKTVPTFNRKIKIAQVREYDFDDVKRRIDRLIEDSHRYDAMETVRQMKEIVPEFRSNHSVYECLDKKE